ncbi:hypothetical protein V6N11_040227 [Hibiscus sabdariffa]|uniref:Uncharacterized protein n=1 Tax=Hibiscus sabdariffa TaxID=183260 RepID=A0ABR2RH79_9ROSI
MGGRRPEEACARGGDGSAKVAPPSLLFPLTLGTLLGNIFKGGRPCASWWVVASGHRAEVGSWSSDELIELGVSWIELS